MSQNKYISNTELACKALDQKQNQEKLLFGEYETPQFWRLSDLELLYPAMFETRVPFSSGTINRLRNYALGIVPEFKDLTPEPVHILKIKDTFSTIDRQTNTVMNVKNGNNQLLTRIACEYIFSEFPGTELQQAYFMSPNKTVEEIDTLKNDIKLEHARDQIAKSSQILSAIVNRARGANKNSFSEIWGAMWHTLYNVQNMDELRNGYNIKTTPLDYMSAITLSFVNGMLQNVISQFYTRQNNNVESIKSTVQNMANIARRRFIEYGSTPEAQILPKRTNSVIDRVKKTREKFWKQYYPISLQQQL